MVLHKAPLSNRLRSWMPAVFWGLIFLYAFWPWLRGQSSPSRTILFFGYSIVGDVMTQTIFPAFQKEWKATTGEHVEFAGSFSGSGTVTNQLIMGVPAELALLSMEPEAERLAEKGILSGRNWRNLPYGGVLNRTPFVILVRPGNPKKIYDFLDLTRPGIKIVHPDPLTSGGAIWAILAEYGAGIGHDSGQPEAGTHLLLGIWRNVVAQAHSARAARTQFENGFGDALITYEQGVLWDQARGKMSAEIVYPSSTIISDQILVPIERNIKSENRNLVNSFIRFLWSEQAQRLFVRAGFRSVNEPLNTMNPSFQKSRQLFTIQDLGGWTQAEGQIVDGIWKNKVLKQLALEKP